MPVFLSYFSDENVLKARFNTSCIECGEQIKTGKEIAKDQRGRWVHKRCAPEIIDLP